MKYLILVVALFGMPLIQAQSEGGEANIEVDPTEWDCSNDHRPDPDNPRNYLLSAGGFDGDAPVFVATCATPLLRFTQNGGVCRCEYIQELQDLLDQECQIRVPSGSPPDAFQILVPNLVRDNINDLYVDQTCFSVLPSYVAAAYQAAGVVPLFFNQTGCRCDWVPGVDRSLEASAVPPPGAQCDVLVDQTFNSEQVSSDAVGNYIQIFPSAMQTNFTIRQQAAFFEDDGIRAAVVWRLAALDFTDLNLVARFDSNSNAGDQLIYSNICDEFQNSAGGNVELRYSPSGRRYSVEFFGRSASCVAATPAGAQTTQLIYRAGTLSLLVNNVDCDISSINPIDDSEVRLLLNAACPFQLGGNVFTNPTLPENFGFANPISNAFRGFYQGFLALGNCENPPASIQNRVQGSSPFSPAN